MVQRDTIFARATAPGRSGIAVIRVSGPQAFDSAEIFTGSRPIDRGMRYGALTTRDGELIDRALILSFVGPESFSGEDIVEFQTHGSIAVVERVLSELSQLDGFRHAEPGEFTRRALENGRMTLSEVEGLSDLIDAQTVDQHRQAIGLFDGRLMERAEEWRALLLTAMSRITAAMDFSEEDLPDSIVDEVREAAKKVLIGIERELEGSRFAERVREGFSVVLVGPPNAGKSTLLNYIAGRRVALTSSVPGTTRDAVEIGLDLDGLPVTFVDTAGLRETEDEVEKLGLELTHERASKADIVVSLWDMEESEMTIPEGVELISVRSKRDLNNYSSGISGLTGQGVDGLLADITTRLRFRQRDSLANRLRHREALIEARDGLERSLVLLATESSDVDLISMELDCVERALSSLIGRVGIEDVLGVVFASFCIGK